MPTELANAIAGEKNRTDNLQRSTVDKSFTQNQIIISAAEVEVIDMPTVYEEQSIAGGFILGSLSFGVLGVSELGDSGISSFLISKIISPNNTFNWFGTDKEEELLTDSSSTATIDNTNQTISFTAGQTLILKCYKDLSNLTSAYLNLSEDLFDTIGNYSFAFSPDNGSNWESTTNQLEHDFTNVGHELLLKITCSTTGTMTIKNSVTGVLIPLQVIYTK